VVLAQVRIAEDWNLPRHLFPEIKVNVRSGTWASVNGPALLSLKTTTFVYQLFEQSKRHSVSSLRVAATIHSVFNVVALWCTP